MTPLSKAQGRPRSPLIDEAIVNAAIELTAEKGIAALTIDAIVTRAGTTRPAFYRRFRNLSELLVVMGQSPELTRVPDTGTLEGDLAKLIGAHVAHLAHPVTREALAEIVGSLSREPEFALDFATHVNQPTRRVFQQIIDHAVQRRELPEDPLRDVEWLYDLAIGPAVLRATFPHSQPLDETLVARSVEAVLAVLGVHPING